MNVRTFSMGAIVTTALAGAAMTSFQSDAQKRTQSNIKQVSLAMLMYAADWDDVMPWARDMTTIKAATYPYTKNIGLWKTLNPNGGQIMFNMAVGGVASFAIDDPAHIPMFYESKSWPDGVRAMSTCDGRAILATAKGWAAASKMLKKKFHRSAKKPLPKNFGARLLPKRG